MRMRKSMGTMGTVIGTIMGIITQHFCFMKSALLLNFKLSLAHRMAFLLSIIIIVMKQILMLMTWKFFFAKYQYVQGWQFNDMIFMYGLVAFCLGFVDAFFYGLKQLPRYIENNQLDTFLLQPKNVVLNIALSKSDITSLGEALTGILFIFYSGYLTNAFFSIILLLLTGLLFCFALVLYLHCIGFFMKDAYDFARELHLNAVIMATQPSTAFKGAFKMLTFTLLPVGFLSFFPVEFIRTGLIQHLWWTLSGTLIFFVVACLLFNVGLKRYESGNMMSFRR